MIKYKKVVVPLLVMSKDSLHRTIRDEINRYYAKGVQKDEMIVVMTPEHKETIEHELDSALNYKSDPTELPKIAGVTIWCTARVKYAEPKVMNISTIQDLVDESVRGMTIND